MNDISYKLIKNGIQALVEEEEHYFKKNVIQSLSIKLNEAISGALNESYKNLFKTNYTTKPSKELQYFLKVVSKPQKIQLNDGSVIQINENDLTSLVKLFESLNHKNKNDMVQNLFKNLDSYKNHLNFYKNCKNIVNL
jgi:hypothetical protein